MMSDNSLKYKNGTKKKLLPPVDDKKNLSIFNCENTFIYKAWKEIEAWDS